MEIVLALGSAIAYGVSDFTGGVLTKRAHVFHVILLSQLVSCVILVLALPFWGGSFSREALQWGIIAGVAGMAGAALLYRGLAIGRMGVVAPITAVLAAVIPLSFGLAVGERPGWLSLIGVAIGLVAVVLISSSSAPDTATGGTDGEPLPSSGRRGLVEALGAGAGFGLFFILLERTPDGSGIWPLAGTRISMIGAVVLLAVLTNAPFRPSTGMAPRLIWLGFINLLADLLYLLATRAGLLSLVAVITSCIPRQPSPSLAVSSESEW
jgi:drug/metabolite transporter (DMT)-like permease